MRGGAAWLERWRGPPVGRLCGVSECRERGGWLSVVECPRGDDVAGDDVARYKVLEWPPWGSRRCRRLSLNRLPTMISSQSNHMIIPRPGMARSLKPIPGAGSKSTGNLAPRRALKMGGSSRVQVLVHQLGSCRAFDVLQAAIQELCVHPCALQP